MHVSVFLKTVIKNITSSNAGGSVVSQIYTNINNDSKNPKCVISNHHLVKNTLSAGSILKYVQQVKQNKFVKRTIKGLKIFLNVFKNILNKKYTTDKDFVYLDIVGFNYNTYKIKSDFFKFFLKKNWCEYFITMNLNIPFTKLKEKRKKSIKKRIRKKILKTL